MSTASPRRSWLLVPLSRPAEREAAARAQADVVVLDLVELVAERDRASARAAAAEALTTATAHGSLPFVQTTPESMAADLQACVRPGLAGVVLSRAESAQDITDAAQLLAGLERERGIAPGTLEIVPALETARANHAAYDILRASERIKCATLGRVDLVMDLRPEPSGEIHMLPYLMQRLVIIAGAVAVTPLGAWWRAPDRGLLATPENTAQAAHRGRAIGFKGSFCLRGNQVQALNEAYA